MAVGDAHRGICALLSLAPSFPSAYKGSVMKRLQTALLLVSLLIMSACKNDPLSGADDPKSDTWSIDFVGPSFMQGWIEQITVADIKGRVIRGPSGGGLGANNQELDKEYARGWEHEIGNVYTMTGADLPKIVYVRWQSIIEQTTYGGWVNISENARSIMRGSTARRCPAWPEQQASYYASLTLGLAPGGVIRVWVQDNCSNFVLVDQGQAQVEPLGPYQGRNQGRYAYPIDENSKRYVERWGIPYGSW